jgi:hypothetical protein
MQEVSDRVFLAYQLCQGPLLAQIQNVMFFSASTAVILTNDLLIRLQTLHSAPSPSNLDRVLLVGRSENLNGSKLLSTQNRQQRPLPNESGSHKPKLALS